MEAKEYNKAEKFVYNDIIEYQDHSIVSKTILKKDVGNVSLFAFDKGESLSEHTAPFDAMIQIIDGNAEIIIDGKSFFLSKDEIIIMPANIPHAVKAIDKFKMVLTMIKK
jgi:quercetin dioxygenase-like cupin family protein